MTQLQADQPFLRRYVKIMAKNVFSQIKKRLMILAKQIDVI
ncbi:MAG: hypothetical protein Q9N32_01410 [Gammaproteobacteria bacterium]|nr:hypothetical protein [Gammaproteobacteria bacterium]